MHFQIVLLIAIYGSLLGQNITQDPLKQRIVPAAIAKENIHQVLGALASNYTVSIADELPAEGSRVFDKHAPCLVIRDGTVADVLDAVVACKADYRWELVNGVVRVFSISSSDPLLDTVIEDFDIKEKTIGEIKFAIAETPEVRSTLLQLGCVMRELELVPGPLNENARRLSFSLHNVTVREILNHIIKAHGGKYWSVVKWGENDRNLWIVIW